MVRDALRPGGSSRSRGVEPDGRHPSASSWTRGSGPVPTPVLRLCARQGRRRHRAQGATRIRVRRSGRPRRLIPAFLYPSTPKEYHLGPTTRATNTAADRRHGRRVDRGCVGRRRSGRGRSSDEVRPGHVPLTRWSRRVARHPSPTRTPGLSRRRGGSRGRWSPARRRGFNNRRRWVPPRADRDHRDSRCSATRGFAKRKTLFVRRPPPGSMAIEDAVRAVDRDGAARCCTSPASRRPQDIQTIASLLILGHVREDHGPSTD